jgi:hypothetical protein
MNRILVSVLGLLLLAVIVSPQSAKAVMGASEPNGVYCEINDVKLFAQSAEDCAKAKGAVTHTVTTTVEPANPNEEPEIQKTKNKQPEAP